jgi:hypothetical protein
VRHHGAHGDEDRADTDVFAAVRADESSEAETSEVRHEEERS